MNVVAVARDQYGVFYETDSYIVYAASQQGQSCDINVVVSIICNDIHSKKPFYV